MTMSQKLLTVNQCSSGIIQLNKLENGDMKLLVQAVVC